MHGRGLEILDYVVRVQEIEEERPPGPAKPVGLAKDLKIVAVVREVAERVGHDQHEVEPLTGQPGLAEHLGEDRLFENQRGSITQSRRDVFYLEEPLGQLRILADRVPGRVDAEEGSEEAGQELGPVLVEGEGRLVERGLFCAGGVVGRLLCRQP